MHFVYLRLLQNRDMFCYIFTQMLPTTLLVLILPTSKFNDFIFTAFPLIEASVLSFKTNYLTVLLEFSRARAMTVI